MGEVDFLVVTQPPVLLALLQMVPSFRQKPIVVYIGTLLNYMVSARDRSWFRQTFVDTTNDCANTVVVTDSWLQLDMRRLSGQTLPVVRPLALYTGYVLEPMVVSERGLLLV